MNFLKYPLMCYKIWVARLHIYRYWSEIYRLSIPGSKTLNPKCFKMQNFVNANLIQQMGNSTPWNFDSCIRLRNTPWDYLRALCIGWIVFHSQRVSLCICKYSKIQQNPQSEIHLAQAFWIRDTQWETCVSFKCVCILYVCMYLSSEYSYLYT